MLGQFTAYRKPRLLALTLPKSVLDIAEMHLPFSITQQKAFKDARLRNTF
jgi:hypothetical protein